MCTLFKDAHCFTPPNSKPNANCWAPEYKKKFGISFGPQWYRKETTNSFTLPAWMKYDTMDVPSSSCREIKNFLLNSSQKVAMSENWLPKGGFLCDDIFINIFPMRNPINRLLSHYQHIFSACLKSNDYKKDCDKMLYNEHYFNVTFMSKTFDIITDNYYTRSLNDQLVYSQPFGMNGNSDRFFLQAKENLNRFDWIILLGNSNHSKNMDLITKRGLGFCNHSFGIQRKRNKHIASIGFRHTDLQQLKRLNKYDIKLWTEAEQLNKLDLASIRKYMQYQRIVSIENKSFYHRICT